MKQVLLAAVMTTFMSGSSIGQSNSFCDTIGEWAGEFADAHQFGGTEEAEFAIGLHQLEGRMLAAGEDPGMTYYYIDYLQGMLFEIFNLPRGETISERDARAREVRQYYTAFCEQEWR